MEKIHSLEAYVAFEISQGRPQSSVDSAEVSKDIAEEIKNILTRMKGLHS